MVRRQCGRVLPGECVRRPSHENKIAEVWMDRNGRRREIVKFVSVCQGTEGKEKRCVE